MTEAVTVARPLDADRAVAGLVANASGYTITDLNAVRTATMTVFATSAVVGLFAAVAALVLNRKLGEKVA